MDEPDYFGIVADAARTAADRIKAETTLQAIDRACSRYILKETTAPAALQEIITAIGRWTDPDHVRHNEITWSTDRVMVPYQLADGRIVKVDDSAARGLEIIDFTQADGSIVNAYRVPAESVAHANRKYAEQVAAAQPTVMDPRD